MKVRCLCPTYGYPPHLLENIIHCFNEQDYPLEDRSLLIADDLGNVTPLFHPFEKWTINSRNERFASLPGKYNAMWSMIPEHEEDNDELIVVMEVDDLYMPDHLSSYVEAITKQKADFVYPEQVWSTYHRKLQVEEVGGRFHASLAIKRSFLEKIGGWVDTQARTFDQQFIRKLNDSGKRAVPDCAPTYCFRWEDSKTKHGQDYMGELEPGVEDNWYKKVQPQYTDPISVLSPKYDAPAEVAIELIMQRIARAKELSCELMELNP
jgi:hypothetical protein